MTYAAGAGAAASVAAAHAAIANATKASGGIVELGSDDFLKLVGKADKPLVIRAEGGLFTKTLRYITNYRGMFLYTKSKEHLRLPAEAELIIAEKIWVPN